MNKFVISLLVTACFVATISASDKNPDSDSKTPNDLPVVTKGQALVIKGENDKIYANDKVLYDEDSKLKEGKLTIELSKHFNLRVNGQKVFTQNPNEPVITKNPKLHAKNISHFEIKIDEQGQATYVLKTNV